jgi:hypothetical protein
MASAALTIRFTCPHCAKVLRTSTRPAPGKKIKCPACDEAFVPDLDDAEDSTGIQERPSIKANAKSSSKNRVAEDEDESPAKKRRRDEEEEDEDDRPSKKKKKAKQKTGGSMMLIVLLLLGGGGLFLVCAGVGLGAFVWPGFMLRKSEQKQVAAVDAKEKGQEKEKEKGKDDDDGKDGKEKNEVKPPVVIPGNNIDNYVWADATMLFGSSMKGLRDKNQLEPLMNQFDAMAPGNDKMPNEMKELLRNSDKVLVSLQPPAPQAFQPPPLQPGVQPNFPKAKLVIAIQTSTPNAVTKFKGLAKLGAEEKLAGKYSVYRPGKNDPNWPPLMAVAGDRLLLFCELNEQELTVLLDKGAKNEGGQKRLLALAKTVESSHFWGVWIFDDNARKGFNVPPDLAKQVPQLAGAAQAIQRANGGSLSANRGNETAWQLQVNLECANQADAASVKAGAEMLLPLVVIGMQAGPKGSPKPPATFVQDINSIKLQTQGVVATLNMQLTQQTLTDLAKIGAAQQKGPKDFPTDLPKEFPKNPPKAGPPRPYTLFNLKDQSFDDRPFQFQQGKRVTIVLTNSSPISKSNADLYAFRDNTQNNANIIAFDERRPNQVRQNGECRVEFVVPATGTYYLRVLNRGPGTATYLVNLTQK